MDAGNDILAVAGERDLTGKDAANALQTLAKIQGYDKPDEEDEEERRRFVLRWLSKCRNCKLMQAFMDIQEQLKG